MSELPGQAQVTGHMSQRVPYRLLASGLFLIVTAAGCEDAPTKAAGPGAGAAGGGPPPLPVLVAPVERRSLSFEISTVGSLRSPETTRVAAEVSGVIVEIDAVEGREIRAGQVIAKLDDAERKAALQVAEARAKNAQIALDRVQPLLRDGVVPPQALDNAQAEKQTADGLLQEARTQLQKATISSPFAGLVGIQTAQLGQYVASGDPIIELTRMDPLELVFGIPEEQATAIRVGRTVHARVGRCGVAFDAVVEALDPQVDRRSRTLAVQARVDNRMRRLIPGMSARVRVSVGASEERLVVPREALVAQGARYLVWVVDGESHAQPRQAVPGIFLPDLVEIRSGVSEGDQVVAAGHQKLRPGAPVQANPWVPTTNPNLELGLPEDDCGPEGGP